MTAVVAFNLWSPRAELRAAQYLNDMGMHLSMVRWARTRILDGHVPLDGWYPYLSLGSAQFHHYQTLPHVVTAYLSTLIGADSAFRWSNYLLLACWPVSVYVGARLLDLGRWQATAAAVLSPLLVSITGYGFGRDSYVWQGLGVWSQLWAMWLLPLAWGTSWRAVNRRGSYALAAALLGATTACHVVVGAVGFIALGAWVLSKREDIVGGVGRGLLVAAGALAAIAWAIVPAAIDRESANYAGFDRPTIGYVSYPATRLLHWLVTGRLFDDGRLPVITALVAVGLVVAARGTRRAPSMRALALLFVLALLAFLGRSLPGLDQLLPGTKDLYLRFIVGVHLTGLLVAGVGAAWLARRMTSTLERLATRFAVVGRVNPIVAVAVVGSIVLVPLLRGAWQYDQRGAGYIAEQQAADAGDGDDLDALIEQVRAMGGGRTYAGSATNWGRDYKVGFVPVYEELLNHDIDAIGFWLRVSSLSTLVETDFDETRLADYERFNVRYLLLPSGRRPAVQAAYIDRRGRHQLWRVPTSGYISVVGDGKVVRQRTELASGEFNAEIVAGRTATVVLRSSYHGRWQLTIDGVRVAPAKVDQSFVGHDVAAGRHNVIFQYESYPDYGWLVLLGAATLVGLEVLPRLRRRAMSP